MINRKLVMEKFAEYVKNYDITNPKIELKVKHTYRVARICEEIAVSENLSGEDLDLAWLIGMLHDIGRFEQCRKYDTFNDSLSVDHAKFGCELLFGDKHLIDNYLTDQSLYACLHDAIYYHNVYRIPEDMDKRTALFTNILRDADKVDIIRANMETSIEDIYNVSHEEVVNCNITDQVMQSFYEHHAVLRQLKKTPVDHIVGHISLMYELVYKKSKEIAKREGYLDKMMNFESKNPDTMKKFSLIREEMNQFLG